MLLERVGEFLKELTERAHANHHELLEKITGGDWSDEVQAELQKAVSESAEDFGYDLDEEGHPIELDTPPARPLSAPDAQESQQLAETAA
jgi:F-type H+-transporting ATPase subunit alpha